MQAGHYPIAVNCLKRQIPALECVAFPITPATVSPVSWHCLGISSRECALGPLLNLGSKSDAVEYLRTRQGGFLLIQTSHTQSARFPYKRLPGFEEEGGPVHVFHWVHPHFKSAWSRDVTWGGSAFRWLWLPALQVLCVQNSEMTEQIKAPCCTWWSSESQN